MADNNEAYKKALKQVDDMLKKQEALKKSTDSIRDSWSTVASELFKLDGAAFFKEVKKSPEEIDKIREQIGQMKQDFDLVGNALGDALNKGKEAKQFQTSIQNAFLNAQKASTQYSAEFQKNLSDEYIKIKSQGGELGNIVNSKKDLLAILTGEKKLETEKMKLLSENLDFYKLQEKFNKKEEKFQEYASGIWKERVENNKLLAGFSNETVQSITQQLAAGKSFAEISKTANAEQLDMLVALGGSTNEIRKSAEGMKNLSDLASKSEKSIGEMKKEIDLVDGALKSIGKNLMNSIIKSVTEFDDIMHDVQKNTGIVMDTVSHSIAFSNLTTEVSKFGMTVEGAGKMMSDMSKELNTTNFEVLTQAAKDFASIEGATGAASGDITTIAGELMRMGESSGQVKDFMQEADKQARMFGISSNKAINAISRNIGKIRQMGFVGGEKSLAKMVATAERLRMNVDEIFDVAKRARSIEGAMDMAAQLQLAGGSFSNINPMDLLAAARKGPAELQKILTTMGKDIGHFSKESGKYEFDPVDVDRLNMVAEATGQSLDSIQNMIQKNAEDTEKLNPFQGMMDGLKDADKEVAKSALSDMIKKGKDGKMEIDVDNDMAKKMGIKDLTQITPELMGNILKQKELDAETLDKQNKNNQSFSKTMDNLKNAFMSIFTIFQPVLEVLATVIKTLVDGISYFGTTGKFIAGSLMIGFLLFKSSVGQFIKQGLMSLTKVISGPKKAIAGMFGGGATGETGEGGDMASKSADGLKNVGDKIKTIGEGIKGAVTGIIGFVKDVAGQLISLVGDTLKQVVQLFIDLGVQIVGGIGQILQSATSITGALRAIVKDIVGIVTDSFVSLMSALGEGISAFGISAAAGFAALTPFIPIILVLTVAIIGLAYAFKLFAEGLGALAPLITSVFEGIGKVVLSIGTAVSMVISTIADSILKLSSIDAGSLFSLAAGLGVLSLAMIAFGAASMIGGVMSFFGGGMFSQLTELAMIAPAIEVLANSLNSAADGIGKLSAAAESLSVEKLEKLKELSDSMSNMSAGGAAMAAMANVANAGGGAGGGEVRKIEVDVKLNGRELQNFIVKDTAIIK